MNSKFINSFLLLLIFPLFLSCKSAELLLNKENQDLKNTVNFDKNSILNNIDEINNYSNKYDYYDNFQLVNFNIENKIEKLFTFDLFEEKYQDSRAMAPIYLEKKLYFLNKSSELSIISFPEFKIIEKKDILNIADQDKTYPTSMARINDNLFAAFSDGKIISFNKDGKLIWENNFNDIIKTPIKIYDESIIILLSNSILSLNINGEINWSYNYVNDNYFQSYGGEIVNLNHLLFFILPNNAFGNIDSIFGEKIDLNLLKIDFEYSINSHVDKLHAYTDILSYLDQNHYLTTIDINSSKLLINKFDIKKVSSSIFYNNSLLTLDENNFLTAFNIYNGKIFWNIDLNQIIKNDKIISVLKNKDSIVVFLKVVN